MRRSISYCDPKFARVGSEGNWKFIYTPSNNLPKGTKLKFDPLSKGRDIDWQQPQTGPKTKNNSIWLSLPDGGVSAAKSIEIPKTFSLQYEFVLPKEIKAGEEIAIHVGTTTGDKASNRAQYYTQRRRPFHLYIDTKGKGDYKDPESFFLDVRGEKLHHLRMLTPALVGRSQRFDVIVRFEDEFNNLTNLAPEGTLVELSYEQQRENLSWKLFVPETGFITLPNFYFTDPGIYKLKMQILGTDQIFYSSPVQCVPSSEKSLYWGSLHGDSTRYDSQENIESALRYFRDDQAFQFLGTSNFESEAETPNPIWKNISLQVAEFNEEDRFSTMLGFSWSGSAGSEGLRQIVYAKDNKPLLRKKDPKSNQLKKIYKSHTPKEILSIPTFTMGKGVHYDFKEFDPEFERVVEIYNSWGSSECTKAEGNPRPIESKTNYTETKEGSIRAALNAGCRFGFVAGGLDDRGTFDHLYESDQVQYSPGLTAIIAKTHTRDAMMQALSQRSCYATTGERMIVSLLIAEENMGAEISLKDRPGLQFNRHIQGFIAGTTDLKEVLLIRNGEIYKTFKPKEDKLEFAVDDTDPLDKVALKPEGHSPFCYYYVRAMQKDGHIAWSSPLWIDLEEKNSKQTAKPSKAKKK
ncbi:MAG: DUF3604 domain-containing protein [Candidatus Algichlamydia australiensis]|nr:DUF3604 domain-containing protein [Chlamydiales bacterium]